MKKVCKEKVKLQIISQRELSIRLNQTCTEMDLRADKCQRAAIALRQNAKIA